jgi:hypothetical protein
MRRASKYFEILDERTKTPWNDGDLGASAEGGLREVLQRRLEVRAMHGAGDKCGRGKLSWPPARRESNGMRVSRGFAKSVTGVFGQAESYLPLISRGAHPAEWAFELFVAGRLTVVHPCPDVEVANKGAGAPNGAPFLMFAELASACMDVEDAPIARFWTERFPFLVRACVLFEAHPALDVARRSERACDSDEQADADSEAKTNRARLYDYYDGRNMAMETVFELRRRHRERLGSFEDEGERREALEDILTWVAGRVLDTESRRVAASGPKLVVDPMFLLPGSV